MELILKLVYVAAGSAATIYIGLLALRSKRRLDARVREFREEIEERGGAPPNPYAALAELYAEEERKDREGRQGQRSKKGQAG